MKKKEENLYVYDDDDDNNDNIYVPLFCSNKIKQGTFLTFFS